MMGFSILWGNSSSFYLRYEQAEFIERELEQMTEQIKSIIQNLNSNQVDYMDAFAASSIYLILC